MPDWAGLPAPLWRAILQAAAVVPRCGARSSGPAWEDWCRLVAVCATVCRALREAAFGPGSGPLWRELRFSPTWWDLSPEAEAGLNAMLVRQGPHAHSVTLCCTGWRAADLWAVLASLTGLRDRVALADLDSGSEAACIGAMLFQRPVREMLLIGSVPCAIPHSVRQLSMADTAFERWPDHAGGEARLVEAVALQEHSQERLDCLHPLQALEDLELVMPLWRVTRSALRRLSSCHPRLRHLHLHVCPSRFVGQHALGALREFAPGVRLELSLIELGNSAEDRCLTPHLEQLRSIHLDTLTIAVEVISPVDEGHLAACRITTLRLCFHDPAKRLARPPPGVHVVYKPLGSAEL